MAPLRNNRDRHRSNRGQIDHDIMEGLPVRQWRKQTAALVKPQLKEVSSIPNDPTDRWRELPMPKGSELYPPHSQALLRAARMGQFNQKPNRPAEEEKENGEEEEAPDEDDSSYIATRWAPIPRDQEQPEPEFLAKRRKGLIRPEEVPIANATAPMRKVKVRKVDAEGNATIFDVLAPEGTVVEGEIAETDAVITEAPAPGTVVEGVGVANAEGVVIASEQVAPTPRRRPPPPKRKGKGPGRGRKKQKVVVTGSEGTPTSIANNGITIESSAMSGDHLRVPNSDRAASTGEDSVNQDGDDGSEEDEDDGEEGDGDDGEATGDEGPATPSRSPSKHINTPDSRPPTVQPSTEAPEVPQDEPTAPIELETITKTETIMDPSVSGPAPMVDRPDTEMTDAPSNHLPEPSPVSTDKPVPEQVSLPPISSFPIPQIQMPPPAGVADTLEPSQAAILPPTDQSVPSLPSIESIEPILSTPPPEPVLPSAPVLPTVEPVLQASQDPIPPPPESTRTQVAELVESVPLVKEPAEEMITDPVVGASIPEQHNALEGLTEPEAHKPEPLRETDVPSTQLPAKPPVVMSPKIPAQADMVLETTKPEPVSTSMPDPASFPTAVKTSISSPQAPAAATVEAEVPISLPPPAPIEPDPLPTPALEPSPLPDLLPSSAAASTSTTSPNDPAPAPTTPLAESLPNPAPLPGLAGLPPTTAELKADILPPPVPIPAFTAAPAPVPTEEVQKDVMNVHEPEKKLAEVDEKLESREKELKNEEKEPEKEPPEEENLLGKLGAHLEKST